MIPGLSSPPGDTSNKRRQYHAASPGSGIVMLDAPASSSTSMFTSEYPSHLPLQLGNNTNSSESGTSAFISPAPMVGDPSAAAVASSVTSLSNRLPMNPQDDSVGETSGRSNRDGTQEHRSSSQVDIYDDDEMWESDLQALSDPNLSDPQLMFGDSSQNVFRLRNKSPDQDDDQHGANKNLKNEAKSGGNLLPPYQRRKRLDSHGSGSKKKRHHHHHHRHKHHKSRRRSESVDSYQDDVADTGYSATAALGGLFSSTSDGSRLPKSSSHSELAHRNNHDPSRIDAGKGPDNSKKPFCYCCDRTVVRSTLSVMNFLAKMLVWSSVIALAAAVVWYSYELTKHGKEPHLIAWFSAGAFVLLGFPISMWGIITHLANYNQPNVQCYIVRILWMVPLYSIESWLCLRFKGYAIYIETLRDCYESYVLYSFLQFLIQVLGGEEALILMLKDKSPTRGVHMWGLQWCVKPWLMGQPVRKTYQTITMPQKHGKRKSKHHHHHQDALMHRTNSQSTASTSTTTRPLKRVHWKSPFFLHCKFGVLQYVLLKFVCSIVVMILERNGIYKEGDFTPKGGYLYICILTNLSQCWALYCLIIFYYATKNELSPINPVGKFLSVKALVFFTWWQSVCISILYQMDLIPHYHSGSSPSDISSLEASMQNPMSAEDAMALDEHGGASLISNNVAEWTSEDVAKGLQDYLICIEMFLAAIVHTFVFPHSEYSPQAVEARTRGLNQAPYLPKHWRRLGRKWKEWDSKSAYSGTTHTTPSDHNNNNLHNGGGGDMELVPLTTEGGLYRVDSADEDDDYLMDHPLDRMTTSLASRSASDDEVDLEASSPKHGFGFDYFHHHGGNSRDEQFQNNLAGATPLAPQQLSPLGPVESEGSNRGDDEDDTITADEESAGEEHCGDSSESSYSQSDSGSCSDDEESEEDEEDDMQPLVVRRGHKKNQKSGGSQRTGFVRALWESTIPQDLRDNTVGIIKGDYVVERKTLLHHAATSDSYELFSRRNLQAQQRNRTRTGSSLAGSASIATQNSGDKPAPGPPPPESAS